jgi:predicted site-specific integrase-resolvase
MTEIKVSLAQASDAFGVDRRTLARYIKDGLVPMVKFNPITGKPYFTPDAINDVLANGLPWRREQAQAA